MMDKGVLLHIKSRFYFLNYTWHLYNQEMILFLYVTDLFWSSGSDTEYDGVLFGNWGRGTEEPGIGETSFAFN